MTQTDIFGFLQPPYRITKRIRLIELFAGIGSQAGFSKGGVKEICPTISASAFCENNFVCDHRIRRLTPLECWRLMDYTDEDFYKAQAVNSNRQLYKQAGNGIVKAVLMAIFKEMIG